MDLLWPALAAVLPGLWSYGHKRRMTWTALAELVREGDGAPRIPAVETGR